MSQIQHESRAKAAETQEPLPNTVRLLEAMPKWLSTVAPAWVLGVGAVVATRYRTQWDAYVSLHKWCSEHGIPNAIRNLDSLILYAVAAFLGSLIAGRGLGGTVTSRLRLQRGQVGWAAMVSASLAPMILGGAVLGLFRGLLPVDFGAIWPKLAGSVLRAPLAEELLFRGLLVGVCAASLGWRGKPFWCNAVTAATLFASVHVEWKAEAVARGWPTLLVTGVGGLWYAWLLARWQSLWVPMGLHAGMNLGWMLSGAGGGAGGGGWMENLLRVGTIAIATWLTVRITPSAVTSQRADIR